MKEYKSPRYEPFEPVAEFIRLDGKERFYKIKGQKYKVPSVTTILSLTNEEKKERLKEWRKRVGEEKAYLITKESAGVGTALHYMLEHFLKGEGLITKNNAAYEKAIPLVETVIENEISLWESVKAIEYNIYYPLLYAGTIDILFEKNGELCIGDFKTARKMKKEEYIMDYKLQLTAYKYALEEHGIYVKKGQIMMVSFDNEFNVFTIDEDEFEVLKEIWFDEKVRKYYTMKRPRATG